MIYFDVQKILIIITLIKGTQHFYNQNLEMKDS